MITRITLAAVAAIGVFAVGTGVALNIADAASSGTPSVFVPIVPCRLVDTRSGLDQVGPRGTPLAQGETATFAVQGSNGNCVIPSNTTAIASNVTVTNPTASSFLTVFPADAVRPLSANLNWTPTSSPTPNQVTVGLSAAGAIKLYNLAGTIDVIVDVVGYYEPSVAGGSGATGSTGPKGDTGPAGPQGATGPQGPIGSPGQQGTAGKDGTDGTDGADGPRGYAAWDTIPSGQTVTGYVSSNFGTAGGPQISVSLPARAPTALGMYNVNFAPDLSTFTMDDDPACTGSDTTPTAPPGKVCIYAIRVANPVQGNANPVLADSGFTLVLTGYSDTVLIQFSWAYTAP